MAGACKIIGSALSILGVAIGLKFLIVMARDDDYRRAELAATRNAGNAMYEMEFGAAKVRRGFELIGGIVGLLVTINGATLLGLGVLASRVPRK